jgi:hypothetical protein
MQDSVVRICRSVLPEYEGQCCQKMQDSFTRIRDAPDIWLNQKPDIRWGPNIRQDFIRKISMSPKI